MKKKVARKICYRCGKESKEIFVTSRLELCAECYEKCAQFVGPAEKVTQ
jgi:NMD protein affecting ribosome stability and mRNA decay